MAKYIRSGAAAGQGVFLAANLKEQLLPKTFGRTLNELIDKEIDTSGFDSGYKTGRPGIDPKTLLKPVLCGYSRGKQSSGKIEELSKYSIIAEALTGDIEADHSAAAGFVSGNSEKLKKAFTPVLLVCGESDLTGGEKAAARLPKRQTGAAFRPARHRKRSFRGMERDARETEKEKRKVRSARGAAGPAA